MIDDERSDHVRWIFTSFLEIGSGTELAREVAQRGIRTPRGNLNVRLRVDGLSGLAREMLAGDAGAAA